MKKIFIILPLFCLIFQNIPMDHRVTAKKMHEHEQPTSHKVAGRHVEMAGMPREAHRPHVGDSCVGHACWSTPFFILACCAMITASEAWSKDNSYCNGRLKPHEIQQIEGYEAAKDWSGAHWAREYFNLRRDCYCERDDYIKKIEALKQEAAKLKKDLQACTADAQADWKNLRR